jgi:hypothetical protein
VKHRPQALGLAVLAAFALVGLVMTGSLGLASLSGYHQSVQLERTTYRLAIVYPPGSPSDLHRVEVDVSQCDALGLVCHVLQRLPDVTFEEGFYPRLLTDSRLHLLQVQVYGQIIYTYHQP